MSSPGTNIPAGSSVVSPDWLLSFLTGNLSGDNLVNTTTVDVIGDTAGYINTGLQPFFNGRVMFDLRDGIIGFAPYDWSGSVTLPGGFASTYPVTVVAGASISVAGSAAVNGVVSGSGPITIAGGTVEFGGANTYTGGITIGQNATLELASHNAGGAGSISFGGVGATLRIDAGVVPTETIGGLRSGDFIDVLGINGGTVAVAGNHLTIGNGGTSLTLMLDSSYAIGRFHAASDGNGGTMISYVTEAQPYVVPIYHGTGTNLIIYASLNGGSLNPYLLDSGSPDMFSTYGSWWPGHTTAVTQQGTNTFSFANGTTYYYDVVPTSIALNTGSGGTVVASATNVDIAQITNIGSSTPAQDFANWASAVAQGSAPFASDNTYGNFSAGLYGTSSLATALAQFPIGDTLLNGFIIQAGGSVATQGSLTIGLDPTVIQQWKSNPNTLVLPMDATGTLLPNPDGNVNVGKGYNKAQIGNTTVFLTQGTTTSSYAIPTVIDTGGGANNIIYNPGNVPDLSAFHQAGTSTIDNGITFTLTGTTAGSTPLDILHYVAGPTGLPGGGNTDIISTSAIPGTLRINPGISLFYAYDIMFDLTDGEVLLQPVACFAAGTRICTTRGYIAVEHLAIGDRLLTHFAGTPQPVRWIGHRTLDCTRHPRPRDVLPVRIAAGAFGRRTPERDLMLSPDHAVYAAGVLIPVRYLINGSTIAQVAGETVIYYHVELPNHDVVLAEGLPVESYLDTGDRDSFANGGSTIRLHPQFGRTALLQWDAEACAPLVICGSDVDAVRQSLRERAERSTVVRRIGMPRTD